MPKTSLIILNYNRGKLVDELLESWFAYDRGNDYEIILLDNGSVDGSFKELSDKWMEKKTIRFIELGKNWGFGKAYNMGSKFAQCEVLVFANPDTQIPENGVKPMVDLLLSDDSFGIVGAKLIGTETGSVQDTYRKFMKPFDWIIKRLKFLHRFPFFKRYVRDFLMWDMDNNQTQTVDWLQGSCMVLRKKDFLEIGGFDERFFIFMEDMDLCRRFWAKNKKIIYYPKIQWKHGDKRASEKGFLRDLTNKMSWWHFASLIKYFAKWGFRNPSVTHTIFDN